jgi:hypothetical protein
MAVAAGHERTVAFLAQVGAGADGGCSDGVGRVGWARGYCSREGCSIGWGPGNWCCGGAMNGVTIKFTFKQRLFHAQAAGVDVNAARRGDGRSPLHVAVVCGSLEIAQQLAGLAATNVDAKVPPIA